MRKPLLVTVTWIDACHDANEMSFDEIAKRVLLSERETDGRLTDVDAERLVISTTRSTDNAYYDGHWAIPIGWLVRVVTPRGRVLYQRKE